MGKVRQISWTEMSSAWTCWAQWDFQYGGRLAGATLRRRALTPRLSEGSAWGAGVAAWHAGGDDWTVAAAIQDSVLEDARKASKRTGVAVGAEAVAVMVDHIGELMADYMAHAKRLPGLTHIEEAIIVPVFPGWEFLCYLDGHTVEDSIPAIVEFKNRDSLMDPELVKTLPQYGQYAWAWAMKHGIDGPVKVLVDERLNRAPEPPRLVQAGKEDSRIYACPVCVAGIGEPCFGARGDLKTVHKERSALAQMTYGPSHDKAQFTTGDWYVQECAKYGVEAKDDVIEALDSRKWQQRVSILFRPDELERAGRSIQSGALLIDELDSGMLEPVRHAKPATCNSCKFKAVCPEPDEEFMVNQLFERGVPKRLMGEKKEGVR